MPPKSSDPNYCPINPELTKPEGEREVKGSTIFLILLVMVLLVVALVLAYLIFY
jgi:hypothetical protein